MFIRSPNKYNAKKITIGGIVFDSEKEGKRYGELRMLERGGEISDLKIHPRYSIEINGIYICYVELDFEYYSTRLNTKVYEDSKGLDNPLSKLKRKLVEARYGIKVDLV